MRHASPTGFQERSRRPRSAPTQTPEALERAIVRLRDSLSPGESRSVSAQVIREHLASTPRRVPALASYDSLASSSGIQGGDLTRRAMQSLKLLMALKTPRETVDWA